MTNEITCSFDGFDKKMPDGATSVILKNPQVFFRLSYGVVANVTATFGVWQSYNQETPGNEVIRCYCPLRLDAENWDEYISRINAGLRDLDDGKIEFRDFAKSMQKMNLELCSDNYKYCNYSEDCKIVHPTSYLQYSSVENLENLVEFMDRKIYIVSCSTGDDIIGIWKNGRNRFFLADRDTGKIDQLYPNSERLGYSEISMATHGVTDEFEPIIEDFRKAMADMENTARIEDGAAEH